MSRAGPIWTKNQRSPFVSQGRPPSLLRKTKQFMSQGRVLCLKPQLRLEQRSRKGQKKSHQSNHDALTLGDSFSQTMEMRFSVHTGAWPRQPFAISRHRAWLDPPATNRPSRRNYRSGVATFKIYSVHEFDASDGYSSPSKLPSLNDM